MSAGNYLDRLLDGVAVEWVEVGKLVTSQRGRRLVKSQLEEIGSYAVYQNSMKPLGYYHESNAQAGTAFVIVAGAAGEIGFSDVAFWAADDVYFFPESNVVDSKYLYHFLLTKQHEISSQVRRASIPRLSIAAVEKLEIPIPCPDNPKKSLEIQAEIVRILDTFTAVTSELTSELTTRKKQYNYYRDRLLRFDDGGSEWKTLGDVAQYSKSRISFEKLNETNYVGVDNLLQNRAGKSLSGYVPTSGNFTEYRKNDVLIGNIRPYLKKIWQADCIGGTNGDVLVIRCTDSSINPRYLYHVLADDKFFDYNMQHAKGAKMPRGSKEEILKYEIPLPSPDEQARIVAILDKFDALTHSLTEGLPREIELRQKQYAYYRDLLLSFPKPEETEA